MHKETRDLRTTILTVAVVVLGALLFLDSLGDSMRGPGGMEGVYFSALVPVLIVMGAAIGYWRKQSWWLATVLIMMVLPQSKMYFSTALYESVRCAPVEAIAWWIAALLLGIGCGYLGRRKDERLSNMAKAGA